MARFDLIDCEWAAVEPVLPTEMRGVARVDDRPVLNGNYSLLGTGAPSRGLLERYGPYATYSNCSVEEPRVQFAAMLPAKAVIMPNNQSYRSAASLMIKTIGGPAKATLAEIATCFEQSERGQDSATNEDQR